MRFISNLNQKIGDYASAIYFVVFVVMIYDVAVRYIWHTPTMWALEFVIMVVGIHYVISGAHAIKNNTHVRIDVIYNMLPPHARRWMDVMAHLMAIVYLSIIVYYGFEQALPAIEMGERSGGGWNSLAPTYMKIAIPVGAALMVLQSVVSLIDSVKGICNEQ
ncbi:TRAP transporter small permease subunit [Candidimonas sp. SYP-B2681]|uniref:TRAP transporter small permease subunit n=1 Tax=Candidimonas sp. SYP-B2681 TaxID=2497686 RepID=UPI000F87F39B|nr:TRAP transporter small permease subunit [Candidimonas sp. SYP-B2681]RTZ48118.1 TRAP transporter small permease subunit [Candidimonas sp. SYP-B2681]